MLPPFLAAIYRYTGFASRNLKFVQILVSYLWTERGVEVIFEEFLIKSIGVHIVILIL